MPTVDVPWPARLPLAHAAIQAHADHAGVDTLLIKGCATDERLCVPGRISTDVDVLVHPEHASRFIADLTSAGWCTLTTFRTGSIFRHAQTMRHPAWGLVDVHRFFPGFQGEASATFRALWRDRMRTTIAGYPCAVPSLVDQALLLVVHAARGAMTIRQDVTHLRGVLSPQEWEVLRQRAEWLNAQVAFAAATGQLHDYRHDPSHDLWAVLSRGGTRSQEWRARLRAAGTLRGKIRLALGAPLPNLDHLRLDLEREPTPLEIAQATVQRPAQAVNELIHGGAKRCTEDETDVQAPPEPVTGREENAQSLSPAHDHDPATDTTDGSDTHGPTGLLLPAGDGAPSRDAPPPGERESTRAGHAPSRIAPGVAVVDDAPAGTHDWFAPVYVARIPHDPPRVLEGTAALIWRVAVEFPETDDAGVVERVAAVVDLPPTQISADVVEFLERLVAEELLVGRRSPPLLPDPEQAPLLD